MTDQQAPSGIWIDLETGEFFLSCVDDHVVEYIRSNLLEAAEKQRDELAAENDRLRRELYISTNSARRRERKLKAERDQALASVGGVIDKAVEAIKADCENEYENGECPSIEAAERATTELAIMAVRAVNPDATAALNEMLADAWDEGYTSGYHGRGRHTNPYRKDET